MKLTHSLFASLAVTAMLLTGAAQAHDRPDRGDRVEQRLDRKGDRINHRLDHRAVHAAAHGHYRAAWHLDRKGNRIDRRLDRKGHRYDRRWDRRHPGGHHRHHGHR